MSSDRDIEQFIIDSFASIWDLELLSVLLKDTDLRLAAPELVDRMRASELVVEQGSKSLVAAGIAAIDEEGRLHFCPVNQSVDKYARGASEFYTRFPGRARRLLIARQAPGLNAFADAFRLRKD